MPRFALSMWLTLLALTVAAAPDAGVLRAGNPRPFLDVPGAYNKVEVPSGLKSLGVPIELSAVVTKKKVPELLEHFRRAFEKAGLFVPDDEELDYLPPLPQVTGLDARSGTSYSMLLQENPDGTTTVIIGRAALHAKTEVKPPELAPLFPGATGQLVRDVEAGQSMSYEAPAKPDEVWKFYRDTLPRAGFRETEAGTFEGKGVTLQLWVNERGPHSGVTVMRRGAAAP